MIRIILFGDSITAGYTDGYPSSKFSDMLKAKLGREDVYCFNRGLPNSTITVALERLQADVLTIEPNYVVPFFGLADARQKQSLPASTFAVALTKLVRQITPEKCLLITPGVVAKDSPVNVRLEEYAQATRQVASTTHCDLIPWHNHMAATPKKMLQADGIHYSTLAYDELTTMLATRFKQRLASFNMISSARQFMGKRQSHDNN
ncbi:SGNH/GDSL hydrolase family protein [Ligilactobacillus sp. LYQ139]|uniref:SGNH/GDSL hydrolase family protein n=1 Tax=Ligilactobacillus sp. LYQ139 TaxID=3378800 RepID=UPI0038548C6B